MTISRNQSGHDLAQWIAQQLDRKGAIRINVLDLQGVSDVTDFLILATGTSQRHMQTLVEAPLRELKKTGAHFMSVEGRGTAWVIADLGDVILHVFDEPTRAYYNIEGLYPDAPEVSWDHETTKTKAHM